MINQKRTRPLAVLLAGLVYHSLLLFDVAYDPLEVLYPFPIGQTQDFPPPPMILPGDDVDLLKDI